MLEDSSDLGRRIRTIRRRQGLSVQGVSREAGLSRSSVTQIEAGTGNPTLLALSKIAGALAVPVAAFFGDDRGTGPREGVEPPGVSIGPSGLTGDVVRGQEQTGHRAEEGHGIGPRVATWTEPDRIWRLDLPPSVVPQHLVVFTTSLSPGGDEDGPSVHEGDEFSLVLEGSCEATVGERRYALEAGDAIRIRAGSRHTFRQTGDTPSLHVTLVLPARS